MNNPIVTLDKLLLLSHCELYRRHMRGSSVPIGVKETPKSRFKIGKISSDIRAFYGFGNADKYYHFNKIQKENRFNVWIQESVIPIAVNAFGDYVMIGIGNDNKGKIYFFYHDRPSKFIELTENLETFLNKCKSEKNRLRTNS